MEVYKSKQQKIFIYTQKVINNPTQRLMNTGFSLNVKFCKNIWICKFLCFSVVFGGVFVFCWFLHHVFVPGLPVWIFFSIFARN